MIEYCSILVDKLNYSTNEELNEIISELKDNESVITEWNKFVDSFINKYRNNKYYTREFEKYLFLPQR